MNIHSDREKFEHVMQLLRTHNCSAAEDLLDQCNTDIPQDVFETALEHNIDFVFKYIHRTTVSTRQNILDHVILDLNVPLAQHIIAFVPQNSYPYLTATMRVYRKENSLPMLQVLTHQLTTSEKIILAKGLMEGPPPLHGGCISQLQERINCLTQDVDEAKLYSTLSQSSWPRTKEAFHAAIVYHQGQRIRAQIPSNENQRSRKL